MTRWTYFTATTLDGFLADEHDSLDWLFTQELEEGGAHDHERFMVGIGAMVMGATTYEWLRDHLHESGEAWPYTLPCFVFTHRDLPLLGEGVRLVAGPPAEHRAAVEAAIEAATGAGPGGRDVWVVGGGDLAAQCAEAGLLDDVLVSIAPVTLGAGRPLFPRPFDLRLTDLARNGAFVCATYDVVGPRPVSAPAPEPGGR